MISLEDLASELVLAILLSCATIQDTINLGATCSRFWRLLSSSRKLSILENAAEREFGPLQDAVQLITHNASQPVHILREVPISLALLKQILRIGRVARRWEELYPLKKWKDKFEDRRLLTSSERYVFRRALYRFWLYSQAFHNPTHTRYNRLSRSIVLERADLLHNWNNAELAEIVDVRYILREVLRRNICPSNGTIQRKFKKRLPDANYELLFNVHHNSSPHFSESAFFYQQTTPNCPSSRSDKLLSKYRHIPFHELGSEGWGDDIAHYYVVEDMLKLDPAQIIWLKDNAPSKGLVQSYINGLGDWFDNNGETFGQTLEFVLVERCTNVDEFLDAVEDGESGVTKRS